MIRRLTRQFSRTNPCFLGRGLISFSFFHRLHEIFIKNKPTQNLPTSIQTRITLNPNAQKLIQHPWYTLAFLHNIATPLSIAASIIEDISPELEPETARILQRSMRSLLGTTQLHQTSLFGLWQVETFDLVAETQNLLPVLQNMADVYHIKTTLPNQPLLVRGYRAAWQQILINLVKNSRASLFRHGKTHQTGTMTLRLVGGEKYMDLLWTDTGPGIRSEVWLQSQEPLTTKWQPKSRGYGLRSIRFWWENAFNGEMDLEQRSESWSLRFRAKVDKR